MPGRRGPSAPVDNEALYKCLNVKQDASSADIKKAFRKLALEHHPDRGGDPEKFKEISAAHEVLTDPEKRKMYDEGGLEALRGEGGGDGHDDIFSMFFGGGRGGGRGRGGPQRGEDIQHPYKASLEDLYNGKTVRLAISRDKPCPDCEGRGGKVGAERSCTDCNGRGVRIQIRQIGPAMVQQMQSVCPTCKGACKMLDERDKCKACKGNKVYKDRKVLEVLIEKGMKNGSKIRFSGESDEHPGTVPGDVIILINEKEHENFKRKGADLLYTCEISLSESLCGFTKTITHLDGRIIKVTVPAGQVVKQNHLKVVQGEGMPFLGNPFTKGRLFILFNIVFPKTLPAETVALLKKSLPRPPEPTLTGEEEECHMADGDINHMGQGDGHDRGAYDEDDDDDGRGQKVQCGQA